MPEGNLIQAGDFNTLDPWKAAFNRSTLDTYQASTGDCVDNRLRITQRSAWYSGASQDLTEALAEGGTFKLSLKARLDAATANQRVYATLRLRDSAGFRYQYLAAHALNGTDWATLESEFEPDWRGTPQKAELLIYGPNPGLDLLVDDASLVKVKAPTPTHLFSSSFETGLENWKSGWGARLGLIQDSYDGNRALSVSGRDRWADAAWQDLTGIVRANTDYTVDLHVKHDARQGSQPYVLYLLYRDSRGWHWQRLLSARKTGGDWQALSATFSVRTDTVTNARLYVMGPAAGVDFALDAVVLDQR
ncbi:MAG: hypothetical protein D6758_00170 [Gammaproteobacteria bacterium]|nr:MAG: hypothetical protein D6758_00170 [Gammaproteobacteria bacterium]